ncbi:hypothetical protein AGMMS49975_16690 [Clostridia bacterium]|nr:hypothetical protein AGMMS49975_16690 [Clostridia bacterium]
MKITISATDAAAIRAAMKDIIGNTLSLAEKFKVIGLRSESGKITAFVCDGYRLIQKTVSSFGVSDEGIIYTPLFDKPKGKEAVLEFESDGKQTTIKTTGLEPPLTETSVTYKLPSGEMFDPRKVFPETDSFTYEIGVTAKYLSSLLNAMSGKVVKLKFQDSNTKPFILECGDEELALLVPCRI